MRRIISAVLYFGFLATGDCNTNGTAADVQAAINSAAPGSTIEINSGTFNWTSGITIDKFIKLKGASGGQTTIRNSTGGGDWHAALISITPSHEGSIEISNLHFVRVNSVGKHLVVGHKENSAPVIVHNCYFENTGFGGRCVEWQNNGGLIYNCEFVSADRSDSNGIAFKCPSSDSAWKAASTLGNKDTGGTQNTYLEDCRFTDMFLQAIDFDDNSRAVVRHCVFNNSAISSHGQDTSPVGNRQWEVYNNEFIFTLGGDCNPNPYPLNINYWFYVRGGTGVIFDNYMPRINSCAWGSKSEVSLTVYNIRRGSQFIPHQTSYPAARQVGFGSDANGRQISDPVYIWGNTGGANYDDPGLINYNPDECGNNQQVSDYLHKGRDYFCGQPKPGYSPYQYPHPLRAGGGQPGQRPRPHLNAPRVRPYRLHQPTTAGLINKLIGLSRILRCQTTNDA